LQQTGKKPTKKKSRSKKTRKEDPTGGQRAKRLAKEQARKEKLDGESGAAVA
jgi:hypothetical protein